MKKNILQELQKLASFFDKLDFKGIDFPVTIKDYHKIKTKNNFSINVFIFENGHINVIFISKTGFENSLKILLIKNGQKSHFALIKDFGTLD